MANYYDALSSDASVTPTETSYFSHPESGLDPRIFSGSQLNPSVRKKILGLLFGALSAKFTAPELWTKAWLAGSGVSHNWSAQRDPADLDCLLGIDYPLFRRSNPEYLGMSDQDIASDVNDLLRENLHPETEHFMGVYDLTFYANVRSNILDIKPYAAYSLTDDDWTVEPTVLGVDRNPEWDKVVYNDKSKTDELVERYLIYLDGIRNTTNDALRRNKEVFLISTLQQAEALFDEIHEGRHHAFSSAGEGYADFTNYRWQAGKQTGAIHALRHLKDAAKDIKRIKAEETYGVSLPDASIMVRRAALQNRNR